MVCKMAWWSFTQSQLLGCYLPETRFFVSILLISEVCKGVTREIYFIMASRQPTPPPLNVIEKRTRSRKLGFKSQPYTTGNSTVFISPDHKAGGVGWSAIISPSDPVTTPGSVTRDSGTFDLEPVFFQAFQGHPNGCFQKYGYPKNGWFIIENPIKMDDLEGTPIFGTSKSFFPSCWWFRIPTNHLGYT